MIAITVVKRKMNIVKKKIISLSKVCMLMSISMTSAIIYADKLRCYDDYEKKIKPEIHQFSTAIEKGDFDYIIQKSSPRLIEYSGGVEKYNQLLKFTLSYFELQGIKLEDIEIGVPQQNQLIGETEICVIPKQIQISVNGVSIQSKDESYMLAIRDLNSTDWSYLDGSGLLKNPNLFNTLFPEASTNLKIGRADK